MSWILVKDGQGHEMVLNLKKDKRIRWRKNFNLAIPDIKEADLPAFYRLDEKKALEKITEDVVEEELRNLDWTAALDESKTNADIQQSSQPQKLGNQEIVDMKEAGLHGKDIIQGLINNNENFEKKDRILQGQVHQEEENEIRDGLEN